MPADHPELRGHRVHRDALERTQPRPQALERPGHVCGAEPVELGQEHP